MRWSAPTNRGWNPTGRRRLRPRTPGVTSSNSDRTSARLVLGGPGGTFGYFPERFTHHERSRVRPAQQVREGRGRVPGREPGQRVLGVPETEQEVVAAAD